MCSTSGDKPSAELYNYAVAVIIAMAGGASPRVFELAYLESRSLLENYTCFQCYVHTLLFQPSFDMPSFDMLLYMYVNGRKAVFYETGNPSCY